MGFGFGLGFGLGLGFGFGFGLGLGLGMTLTCVATLRPRHLDQLPPPRLAPFLEELLLLHEHLCRMHGGGRVEEAVLLEGVEAWRAGRALTLTLTITLALTLTLTLHALTLTLTLTCSKMSR